MTSTVRVGYGYTKPNRWKPRMDDEVEKSSRKGDGTPGDILSTRAWRELADSQLQASRGV